MKKLVIWGTGYNAEKCVSCLNASVCEILAFVETLPKKKTFRGLEVIAPDRLADYGYDYIIIASQYALEIGQELKGRQILEDKVIDWLDYCQCPERYPDELCLLFSENFLTGLLMSSYTQNDTKGFEFYKEKYSKEYALLLQKETIYVYDLRVQDNMLAVSRLVDILINQGMQKEAGILFIPDESEMDSVWYHNLLFQLDRYFFVLWDEMKLFYAYCRKQFSRKFLFDWKDWLLSNPVFSRRIPASRYMNFAYCFVPYDIQKKIDAASKIHFFYFYSSRIGENIRRIFYLKNVAYNEKELIVLIPEDYANTLTLGANACLMELVSREFCMIRDKSELWFWVYNIMEHPHKCIFHRDINRAEAFRIEGTMDIPTLDFSSEELVFGEQLIKKKLNLTKSEYVCICIRDAKYMKTVLNSISDEHNNYRNDSFLIAEKAINYFGSQNLTAVRMGQIMEAIPLYENCIDFPNECYDEYLDLILHRNCKFILCAGTGAAIISLLFAKPMAIYVQFYPMIDPFYAFKKEDLIIFNKIKDIHENRILSIRETIYRYYEFQVIHHVDFKYFEDNGLSLLPIAAEELCDLAEEMNSKLDGTWLEQPEDEKLLDKFYCIVDEVYNGTGIDLENYCQPEISMMFLRTNRELL